MTLPSGSAIFSVAVNGQDVSLRWIPIVTEILIVDNGGSGAGSCTVEFDDEVRGQIALPPTGAPIVVSLGWQSSGVQKVFTGFIDAPCSHGSRALGHMLSLTATTNDPTGGVKTTRKRASR